MTRYDNYINDNFFYLLFPYHSFCFILYLHFSHDNDVSITTPYLTRNLFCNIPTRKICQHLPRGKSWIEFNIFRAAEVMYLLLPSTKDVDWLLLFSLDNFRAISFAASSVQEPYVVCTFFSSIITYILLFYSTFAYHFFLLFISFLYHFLFISFSFSCLIESFLLFTFFAFPPTPISFSVLFLVLFNIPSSVCSLSFLFSPGLSLKKYSLILCIFSSYHLFYLIPLPPFRTSLT